MKVRPAMFRGRPFATLTTMTLLVIGGAIIYVVQTDQIDPDKVQIASGVAYACIGLTLLIWLKWWLHSLTTCLIIDEKNCIFSQGILSRNISEMRVGDIRNIQLHQSVFQRLCTVGDLAISSAGQSDIEIEIKGIPSPNKVKRHIDALRDSTSEEHEDVIA